MDNLLKYFSTAPVILIVWLTFTTIIIIFINTIFLNTLNFPCF